MQDHTKKKLTLEELIESIDNINIEKQPSISDYIKIHNQYFELITSCIAKIKEYNQGTENFDYSKMNSDLVYLGAAYTSLAPMIGYLQGMSSKTEDIRKINKSKYSIRIKDKRNSEDLKITEADVDNASRLLSENMYIAARDTEVVSRMMTSSWHAIGSFVEILRGAVAREFRELGDKTI